VAEQTSPAVQRVAEVQFRAYESEYSTDGITVADFYATARADLTAALDVEEMARVLLLHASFKASPEIQETDIPWWWECDGCSTRLAQGGTTRSDVFAGLAKHQAAALRAAILGSES